MNIIIIGLNHNTASIELRECLAFSTEETFKALDLLKTKSAISETILLSTCNRVEIVLTTKDSEKALLQVKEFLSLYKKISIESFENVLYVFYNEEAVNHLFRVASSLDSMIVGEPQILGQIKEAYRIATVNQTSGVILNRLLHRTFFVAKRVRTETGIGDHAVSISYAAIELGKKIFGSLNNKKIMLIGAGEMAELAVEHLIRHEAGDIYVSNRTFENGLKLAQRFNGTAIRFEETVDYLKEVDIVISSTGSRELVLHRDEIKKVMKARKNRPVFFIDIAVPRDIDPKINQVSNAYVYDIDDLKGIIDHNIEERKKEAIKAERIIDEAVVSFLKWFGSLDIVPTIKALKNKLESIGEAEIKKTLHYLSSATKEDEEALERMTVSLINKFLHDPILFLKREGCYADKNIYLDMTRRLFNLDEL